MNRYILGFPVRLVVFLAFSPFWLFALVVAWSLDPIGTELTWKLPWRKNDARELARFILTGF